MRRTDRLDRVRPGITLVEILATLVLASLMLGALARTVRLVHRQEKLLAAESNDQTSWRRRLENLIELDLANSRQIFSTPEEVTLWGYGGRSSAGRTVHVPSRVRYRIERLEQSSWLIRDSEPLSGNSQKYKHRMVLCDGAVQLGVGRAEDDLVSLRTAAFSRHPYTTPANMRLVVFDRGGGVLADTLLWQERGTQ